MIYLSVQPDNQYFHWQVEVYINNFINVGINPNKIEVIFLYNGSPSVEAKRLQSEYNTCRFFFYPDDRPDKSYIPSIKPWGVFKHLSAFPDLNKGAIFYHDSDIIFIKKINELLFERDKTWYLSDTVSYIGYNYVASKGKEQLLDMLDVLRIERNLVKNNQKNSGGAQYIVKDTTPAFWYKVYEDCPKLYSVMSSWENKYNQKPPQDYLEDKYHPIQKWCAEMWSTLWNAWMFGHQTEVHKDLDFVFATDSLSRCEKVNIMHNAGVTSKDSHRLFHKGDYINKSPLDSNLEFVDKNSASFKYVQSIEFVKIKKSHKLI
jgi:hypothetical protein